MENQGNKGEIIIYKADSGPEIQVKLENETIWLTQVQMADLFDINRDTIGDHIQSIYKTAELSQNQTTGKFPVVQIEGKKQVKREVSFYNLDMVISVGYRVNSKRGTQFRIWATKHLREYILKGYLVNEKRLKENEEVKLKELQQAVGLMQQALEARMFEGYENLLALLGNIGQTYDGKEVYPTLEEKAAHLLYFAVKNHPFVDGNKRIGALLFILFLIENRFLHNKKGERKINDSALTAITLLVAESKPVQKEVIVKVIVNLINKK